MDDMQVDRYSPSNNPVDRDEVQDGLTSKQAASSKAVVEEKVRGNKNVTESSKSEKKKSSALPAKRTLDKSSKTTASGAKKVAKTKSSRDKSPAKKKTAASREKSPVKKKAAASKDKKPKKSAKETGKKTKPDQKAKPATRSTTKK
ncbi:hypothetical protein AVEN_42677-1 [Araneus ventricosus]|uniref:Uncharacterized protein n=1 Tax=Araneus ventricosus TaxID=182803 RepID=A0A4Y2BPW5_ARAVE|nr:hypothetical protein AVEN_42677-1 [Araneus ventricosus]